MRHSVNASCNPEFSHDVYLVGGQDVTGDFFYL